MKTPIIRPDEVASSIRRTDASRATASGMNEFGNSTVSRSGNTGSSGGMTSGASVLSSFSTRSGSFGSLIAAIVALAGDKDKGEVASPLRPVQSPSSVADRQSSVAGRQSGLALHVDEQRRRATALRHQTLALLRDLACLLAILAADGERQRAQTTLGDLLAALEAVPEGPFLEASESLLDLVERLRLHLDQGELDVVLDIRFGGFRGVEHPVRRTVRALRSGRRGSSRALRSEISRRRSSSIRFSSAYRSRFISPPGVLDVSVRI